MAKATEQTALQKSNNAQDTLNPQNAKVTAGDVIENFADVETESLQELTAEYLQLKENTTYNMVFVAMTKFTGNNGGEIDAVELVDQDGNKFINGNTVLVNSLKKVTQMPCLVRIVTGIEKASSNVKGGKYMQMDVLVLPKTTAK